MTQRNPFYAVLLLIATALFVLSCNEPSGNNDTEVNSLDNLPNYFDYTAYWENNESVQESCAKKDTLCIADHWFTIGGVEGLPYRPVSSDAASSGFPPESSSSIQHASSGSENISSETMTSSSEKFSSMEFISSSEDSGFSIANSSSSELPDHSSSSQTQSSSSSTILAGNSSSTVIVSSSSKQVIQIVATPEFSVTAGTYITSKSLALSTTTVGAIIYFTTDGSTPTNSSTEYSRAISVDASQTIKAIAVKADWENSAVASAEYIINALEFGTFTDSRDSNVYKWVQIGTQVWMAENLNYKTSSGSFCYSGSIANCNTYGRLYTWRTVRGVCPTGWHLPSDEEWEELAESVANDAGLTGYSDDDWIQIGKLLKADTSLGPKNTGTDAYGFSALMGGRRTREGHFYLGYSGYWWSSTEYSLYSAYQRRLYYSNEYFYRDSHNKSSANSVRCIQDSP